MFDKETSRFTWQRRTMLGVKRKEFWLSDIQSVIVVELSDGQGGNDSNLYLKMTDGSTVKIFSGQLITLKDKSRAKAKKMISDFLESAMEERESRAPQREAPHEEGGGEGTGRRPSAPPASERDSPASASSSFELRRTRSEADDLADADVEDDLYVTPSRRYMQRRVTGILGRGSQRARRQQQQGQIPGQNSAAERLLRTMDEEDDSEGLSDSSNGSKNGSGNNNSNNDIV